MKSIPTISFPEPKEEDIEEEFFKIFSEDLNIAEPLIREFLAEAVHPERFMRIYLDFHKTQEHCHGMGLDRAQAILFPLIDELNKAYGKCVLSGYFGNGFEGKSYETYREEIKREKIRRASSKRWNLWEIKDVYAMTFHRAIPEKNGKVLKGEVLRALERLVDENVIFSFEEDDIILKEDKNGNIIWFPRKGQINSFFKPNNTVRVKIGSMYNEVIK